MRAKEFIVEYKRDETAKRLGSRLVAVEPEHTDVDEILSVLERMDPTPNKKYVQWIAQQYITKIDGHLQFRLEDAPQIRQTLERFEQIKRNLPQKDINRYTYYSLEDTVDQVFDNTELEQPQQTQQQTYVVPDDADVLYNGPLGLLAIPRTVQASCELGKGSSWCTARNDNNNMFGSYAESGDLYIWIDKSGKKYQFHVSGGKFQFKDQKNRPIDDKTLSYFRNEHPVLKKLFVRLEQSILKNPEPALRYAQDVIGGRWPKAEPVIAQDPFAALEYAREVIGGRWPPGEKAIAQDPERAYMYAQDVIGGRWPPGEKAIAQDPELALRYAREVIGGRFPEGEPEIAQTPWRALPYARNVIGGRFPKAEPVIANYPSFAADYARDVIRGRWPEVEPVIAKTPMWAVKYAKGVIKGRWPKAEPVIAQDPFAALEYARDVIGGRWPEAEPEIAQNPRLAFRYAREVIKGPWPEAGIE